MVPLTRPWLGDEEAHAAAEVLASGMLVSGERVERFEAEVAQRCGRAHAVAVSSGTSALELAMRVLGVGPGDQVLVPDLTWPSPAHAARLCGADVIAVDVHPDEWNATADGLRAARTERTKLAVVIDQFGFPARHLEILEALADLPILGDAACALGSTLDGRPSGSFGAVACLSFHPRKVLTTGEGGMCLTDDAELATRLRVLRNHGQQAGGGFAEPAGNQRLTDVAAAIGLVQMQRLDEILSRRRALGASFRDAFAGLAAVQEPADGANPNFQTFGLRLPEGLARGEAISQLRAAGVGAGLLSYALHRIPSSGAAGASCPESARMADRGIALPLFPTMTDTERDLVIEAVRSMLAPHG